MGSFQNPGNEDVQQGIKWERSRLFTKRMNATFKTNFKVDVPCNNKKFITVYHPRLLVC